MGVVQGELGALAVFTAAFRPKPEATGQRGVVRFGGPYEVLGSLGRGGMGEIYRARDTRLGRAVAALSHPNIVALHDVGREGAVLADFTCLLRAA